MQDVVTEYAVRCPKCRAQAVASMIRTGTKGTYREAFWKLGAARRTCRHCGFARDSEADRGDDYELWYVTKFQGRRLWAANRQQLNALIEWLERGVTERGVEGAYWEALPKWLRAGKNRLAILDRLRRLRGDE
ncbi:MAG TPA: hypothetical protein PK156_31705 [Polyangium sp.]|nr:hypothetical protein [Polyangium sp.]